MIGFLKGKIIHKKGNILIVQTDMGVGYEVSCSQNTYLQLPTDTTVHLWIHTVVREDALELMGFTTEEEKSVFLELIKVSGVGPKTALQILSDKSTEAVIYAIENEDIKEISKWPKIGRKKAEQLILSLKGKFKSMPQVKVEVIEQKNQVASALLNLGFKRGDIETSFQNIKDWSDFQQVLKDCLQNLTTTSSL